MSSNYLMVPIQVDALQVESEKVVVQQAADFDMLPYFNGSYDMNGDNANLSEAISSQPFNNETLRLGQGIHLHWALPDILTRGSAQDSGIIFPEIPNRWLVRRARKDSVANVWSTEKQWMVESDYLYPETIDKEGVCVSYPYKLNETGTHQTFRFVGRKMLLSVWNPDLQNDATAEYLSSLTSVGYGNFYFSSFYPNCYSMLGFNDPDPGAIDDTLRYEVIGWYSSTDKDELRSYVDGLSIGSGFDEMIESKYNWKPDQDVKPDGLICYTRLTFSPSGDTTNADQEADTTLTVGNTASEALAARLAKMIDEDNRSSMEKQLQAIQYMDRLEQLDADYVAQFHQLSHEKEFMAKEAGLLWTVVKATDSSTPLDQKNITSSNDLPETIADLLDKVNELQVQYNKAQSMISSLRKYLFADWYKYMMSKYPSDRYEDDYPDIDRVMHFIRRKDINPLDHKMQATGTVAVDKNDTTGTINNIQAYDSDEQVLTAAKDSSILAARLAAYVEELMTEVNSVNSDTNTTSTYNIRQIPAPRYWQPNDSVVLITGDAAKATQRHGQDGILDSHVLTTSYSLQDNTSYNTAIFDEITGKIDTLSGDDWGLQAWTQQPWNPFLLEWETNVYPIKNKSNHFSRTGRYESGFITDNYEATMDNPDLTLKTNMGALITDSASAYNSRTILSSDSGTAINARLETYLRRKVVSVYEVANDVSVDDLAGSITSIKTWYESTYFDGATTDETKASDAIYTAIRAYEQLGQLNYLSQALGGFNHALVMHQQTMELPITDPLGFEEYRNFTHKVRDFVGDQTVIAPDPLIDYNPIRTGCMAIDQLRLIDNFGQVRDLDTNDVTTTEKMTTPGSTYLVSLPPRLVQPSRVHFRWLSASEDEKEMNAHPSTGPICGWIVPNYFDRTLSIYDNDGDPMGAINTNGDWEAIAGYELTAVADLTNTHLKKMVEHLINTGQNEDGFVGTFLSVLESALDNIEPNSYNQNQTMSLLMGRPMALVRAYIDLELQGLPTANHDWSVFVRELNTKGLRRENDNFPNIHFPVRLGHYKQLNDGLVGYWIETEDSSSGYENDLFYAPQADEPDSTYINAYGVDGNPINFYQSVNDDPFSFSMLMDVQGVIHATTGILPAKALSIPPEQYAEALEKIAVTFLVAPFMSEKDKVKLSIPSVPGYDWSWLHKEDNTTWSSELTMITTVDQSVFTTQTTSSEATALWDYLIDEAGWLGATDNTRTRAYVIEASKRTLSALGTDANNNDFSGLDDETMSIFSVYGEYIRTTSTKAAFAMPEAREGWLKLTKSDEE